MERTTIRTELLVMTTTKETCPKCGAEWNWTEKDFILFDCHSSITPSTAYFHQSDRCRISELEKENEILQRKLDHETSLVAALQKESLILEKEVEGLRAQIAGIANNIECGGHLRQASRVLKGEGE